MKRAVPIPKKTREAVEARSKGLCEAKLVYCVMDATEKHHIKSRARGGSNDPKNILDVCWSCHERITRHMAGTDRFRTHSWQDEGERESDT